MDIIVVVVNHLFVKIIRTVVIFVHWLYGLIIVKLRQRKRKNYLIYFDSDKTYGIYLTEPTIQHILPEILTDTDGVYNEELREVLSAIVQKINSHDSVEIKEIEMS